MAVKKIKEFNFFMRKVFKILTKMQKVTIKWKNVEPYYFLSKVHFALYFKKSLVKEAKLFEKHELAIHVNGDAMPEYFSAINRHARLVVKCIKERDGLTGRKLYLRAIVRFHESLLTY